MVTPSPLLLPGRGTPRELTCRVLQSPLAGVSDRVFRGLVRRWAPDALLFTEMVNATSLELGHGRGKVEELSEENRSDRGAAVRPPAGLHGRCSPSR